MFKLSNTSNQRLSTVNPILQSIIRNALKNSPIDFGIPEFGGKRSAEEQHELFRTNKSKCDGYTKLSRHQSGNAIDVYAYVNGRASWNPIHLAIIAGVVLAEAKRQGVKVRWGGTFGKKGKNLDGWDKPHFELIGTRCYTNRNNRGVFQMTSLILGIAKKLALDVVSIWHGKDYIDGLTDYDRRVLLVKSGK